jgi:hypothetical protein
MKTNEAKEITGSLSKPSKMPGFAYGLPAKECKTGKKLQNVEGSTCYDCYALKGCYVFKVVQDAQYKRLAAIRHPLWVRAMAAQISSKNQNFLDGTTQETSRTWNTSKRSMRFARLTPDVQHWMPTREAWVKPYLKDAPDNLVIRFSMPMVNQEAAESWPHTSTVVTTGRTCPAPDQDNACGSCRQCWDKNVKNIAYGQH